MKHQATILTLAAALAIPLAAADIRVAGKAVELRLAPASARTVRISVLPIDASGKSLPVAEDLILAPGEALPPFLAARSLDGERSFSLDTLDVRVSPSPLRIRVSKKDGTVIQELTIDAGTGAVAFRTGAGPLLGLGGGGTSFDRRGVYDPMDNGHRSGEYQIFGSRTPVPYLIGTDGWALFVHRPYEIAFDLRGPGGILLPKTAPEIPKEEPLPLDVFVVAAETPAAAFSEYGNITGRPVMPPKWALGYIQSHRTLGGPADIIREAETFREKKLPCDGLIYLGTGYCPTGWNLGHASLDFNPATFDKPKEMIDKLHALGFKVVLHVNNAPKTLHGEFPKTTGDDGPDHIANYWERHRPVFALGVDGWWPDDGDELSIDSRLSRYFIYRQGPLSDRPGMRTFSLQRSAYPGLQRFGTWVWSGDVFSLWKTLAAHVPVGVNFSLSASPFWGTDIGGFSPTKELTGELYVRWFQFGAFTPIFRSHGRMCQLRLPWGWNLGEMGPYEVVPDHAGTAAPDASEFHNAEVEPICRRYLELRYQLMPYLYSAVREACDTGMPIMRALWIHYPDDPTAVALGDEYLWGRDILVAPVTEKGAVRRDLYLPEGLWYDFWSNRPFPGKQRLSRYVDLATMPIYVRAGAVIPFDPVRQSVDEPSTEPTTLRIYPGADGAFVLYEDDGKSIDDGKAGARWTRIAWNDATKTLSIAPDARTKAAPAAPRTFKVQVMGTRTVATAVYAGTKIDITL